MLKGLRGYALSFLPYLFNEVKYRAFLSFSQPCELRLWVIFVSVVVSHTHSLIAKSLGLAASYGSLYPYLL